MNTLIHSVLPASPEASLHPVSMLNCPFYTFVGGLTPIKQSKAKQSSLTFLTQRILCLRLPLKPPPRSPSAWSICRVGMSTPLLDTVHSLFSLPPSTSSHYILIPTCLPNSRDFASKNIVSGLNHHLPALLRASCLPVTASQPIYRESNFRIAPGCDPPAYTNTHRSPKEM